MKKIVLVTGGSGLVGQGIKSICQTYENEYTFIFLSSKDCNLLDSRDTEKNFKKIKPNLVIHLAAHVGGLFKNMNQKVKMLEDNLIINTNVLQCAYKYKVEKLVACLSTCIFPDLVQYPINESMLHDGPPHHSNDSYAYAKRILEIQCSAYNKEKGTRFICVVPTNVYGEHDNYNLEDSHVVPALIHQCYLAKQTGEPFIVKGSGKPLRQFIYSGDLGDIIVRVLKEYQETESIIVSPSVEYSIRDIVNIISKKFEYRNIKFDETFSDGQYRKTVCNTRLLNFLGGKYNFISLEEGIPKTIDFFISNYSSIRK
jgi:GDP-L-fucose synthase